MGEIIDRLEFRSAQEISTTSYEGRIQVKGGKTARIKSYFFEAGEDEFAPENGRFQSHSSNLQADVVVLWLSEASENTRISIDGDEAFSFQLSELLSQPEVSKTLENTEITANLLLDKEIGYLQLEAVGENSQPGADFSFVIMADPQGGDPEEEGNWPTRMKIHNAWIEDSIRRTNEMDPQHQFTLVLGDIVDSQGQMANFEQMNDFMNRLESPVLYAIGNHETRYSSKFIPGYNMEAFNNYFAAQKALNGMEQCCIPLIWANSILSSGQIPCLIISGKPTLIILTGWSVTWRKIKRALLSFFNTFPAILSVSTR